MAVGMRVWTLLAVFIGFVYCNTFDYEHIHDTCGTIAKYMKRRDPSYSQKFSEEPDTALTICGSGYTCCTPDIENMFYSEVSISTRRISYSKSPYVKMLNSGKEKIGTFITQVLTMTAKNNQRTKDVVEEFLELSEDDLPRIDELEYPVAVLLDIAESNGVTDLELMNSPSCIREMRDLLVPLVTLQVSGLKLARLLYQAIPEGVNVLNEMNDQDIAPDCLKLLTRSQRCNSCLDSTNVRPCRDYCLAITEKCFSHLETVSESWEEYARLTELTMDRIDKFAKVYEHGLGYSINSIRKKLQDHDIADMCGFSVSNSLEARRHVKRDAPESKTRDAIFNGSFMVGMLGKLDELHCGRYSTENARCWNGSDVGHFTGNSDDIEISNDVTVTEGLAAALSSVATFNKQYKKIESIEIEGPEYNIVAPVSEAPVFDNGDSAAVQTALISIGLFSVSLLLH